ncbi:GTP cyclohydrolase II [Caenispirillum salinarum]|uniref:GTP cyclohydrolase II n=1 Tax=Caenispirillum salinarum TaxID=859058 RepID=UPI00384AA683
MTDASSRHDARDTAETPTLTAPLTAVDRATAEVRRGGMVVVMGGTAPLLVMAAEAVTPETLETMTGLAADNPRLAVTARRARLLDLAAEETEVAVIGADHPLDAPTLRALAEPGETRPGNGLSAESRALETPAGAAVQLMKIARLLPAAVIAPLPAEAAADPVDWALARDIPRVAAADVLEYEETAARTLMMVGEARVPLEGAENARILAFRPADGGTEHLAILIGEPKPDAPVLARLHSECFTGDLLGSLRCDCGDQLRGAIEAIAKDGAGVLLYLAQEGRGIGLVNKLRAYTLQDQGYDTIDANRQLGFDDDERIYAPAAEMLRKLGFGRVRLMTNNPLKVEQLARHGVEVTERVPHVFPSNPHNLRYLQAKQTRSGHLF